MGLIVKGKCEAQKVHMVCATHLFLLIGCGLKYSPPKTHPKICAPLFILPHTVCLLPISYLTISSHIFVSIILVQFNLLSLYHLALFHWFHSACTLFSSFGAQGLSLFSFSLCFCISFHVQHDLLSPSVPRLIITLAEGVNFLCSEILDEHIRQLY